LARVVVGRKDSDPKVLGKGIDRMIASGKTVEVGLYSEEVTAWNLPFFATRGRSRPFVAAKWAQTLDGQLADDSGTSQWISGPASRSYTHWLRQRYDAILIGANTFLSDQPQLNVRSCAFPIQHQPMKLIWDPKRLISPAITESSNMTTLSEPNVSSLLETLQSEFEKKQGRPFQSLFVEGGPGVLSSFMEAGVVDAIHVFVCPKITGGERHRIHTQRLLQSSIQFRTLSQARLGDDILIEMISPELEMLLCQTSN
jgi:diaminohydroxyphosphoribosylaminopyrimidine deaminase/5-amino-6-(5-phosphoribosylamino)uracil reductase